MLYSQSTNSETDISHRHIRAQVRFSVFLPCYTAFLAFFMIAILRNKSQMCQPIKREAFWPIRSNVLNCHALHRSFFPGMFSPIWIGFLEVRLLAIAIGHFHSCSAIAHCFGSHRSLTAEKEREKETAQNLDRRTNVPTKLYRKKLEYAHCWTSAYARFTSIRLPEFELWQLTISIFGTNRRTALHVHGRE